VKDSARQRHRNRETTSELGFNQLEAREEALRNLRQRIKFISTKTVSGAKPDELRHAYSNLLLSGATHHPREQGKRTAGIDGQTALFTLSNGQLVKQMW